MKNQNQQLFRSLLKVLCSVKPVQFKKKTHVFGTDCQFEYHPSLHYVILFRKQSGKVTLLEKTGGGEMTALFKYLTGCHSEEDQDLFLIIPECRTHDNGLKLQKARFRLNIGKKHLNCQSSTTMESIVSRRGERSNTGGLQEKFRQPPGRSLLIWIPALSLDLTAS